MLDIHYIREHVDEVRKNLNRRGRPEFIELFDELIISDKRHREILKELEEMKKKRNDISKQINELKKKKEDISRLINDVKELPNKIKNKEDEDQILSDRIRSILLRLPNIMLSDVPDGKDENDNVEIRKWGEPRKDKDKVENHVDWLIRKDYADFGRAAKTSGARFYFLKDKMVKLQMAVLNYTIDYIMDKGFKAIMPPFLTKRAIEESATELGAFEQVLYKVEDEDLFLIPTTEHPILGYYYDEIIDKGKLPLMYVGYSPAFRKEAGAHGKDMKGIFRVHQFMQTEMFVFCEPQSSEKIHEEMVLIEEGILKSLKIPYRVVKVCSGDLPLVAAKMYDIEAWFPAQQAYRELTSCSNCLTYQSIPGKIRMINKRGDRVWLHTLNGTGLPDTRTLVAIIENFQDENGDVIVPEVLRKYTGFDKL